MIPTRRLRAFVILVASLCKSDHPEGWVETRVSSCAESATGASYVKPTFCHETPPPPEVWEAYRLHCTDDGRCEANLRGSEGNSISEFASEKCLIVPCFCNDASNSMSPEQEEDLCLVCECCKSGWRRWCCAPDWLSYRNWLRPAHRPLLER